MDLRKDKKIKVVYVMPSLDRGGAERFLVDLISNLDKELFEPTLILFKRGGLWQRELEREGIKVLVFRKQGKIDFYNFWRIFNSIRKIRPMIVHTQLGGDVYGRLAARILKVPIILNTEQNINREEGYLTSVFKRLTSTWNSQTIAISRTVEKDAKKRYLISSEKICVIPNGLNISKFSHKIEKGRADKSKVIFGTLGRLTTQKNQLLLIKAWSALKNKDAVCLIAGQGPLRNRLKGYIKRLGLKERVKLVGKIDNPSDWFKTLDVFLFPSLWEGQGLALLEASLSGLPTIVSPIDAIKEIVDEEKGFFAKIGDIEDWSNKIDWMIEHYNDSEVKQKNKNLRQEIVSRYDIKKISNDYVELYKRLLKERHLL